jgi:hypothetical protein
MRKFLRGFGERMGFGNNNQRSDSVPEARPAIAEIFEKRTEISLDDIEDEVSVRPSEDDSLVLETKTADGYTLLRSLRLFKGTKVYIVHSIETSDGIERDPHDAPKMVKAKYIVGNVSSDLKNIKITLLRE